MKGSMNPLLVFARFVICFILLSSAFGTPEDSLLCVEGMPDNCTCYTNASHLIDVRCNNSNLTNIPTSIPPAINIYIENNSIAVISGVPWKDGGGSLIQTLTLTHNGITYIQNGVFRSLNKLRVLFLSHNNICHLEPLIFEGLEKLERLILMYNPLYHITSDTFDGNLLPSLSELSLSHTKLYAVDPGFVDSLPSLATLTMSHNRLRTIPILGCVGHSLDNLFTWSLFNNEIESFDNTSAGCHMAKVAVIDLSHNNLTWIDSGTLGESMASLAQLTLRDNQLSYVHPNTFEKATKLSILDLSNNKLTNVAEESLPWDSLHEVLIRENPWDCNCGNDWIVAESAVVQHNEPDSVRCATPEHFYNRSVFTIQEDTLHKCTTHHSHILGLVVGIISCIVVLCVGCVIFYRLATRKRTGNKATRSRLPRGTLTSSYRRMDDDNDVTFTQMDDVRPYKSTTMPSTRERAPIREEVHNFSI